MCANLPGTRQPGPGGRFCAPASEAAGFCGPASEAAGFCAIIPSMVQSAMTQHGLPRAVLEAELTAKYYGPARKRLAKADGLSESVPEISARLLFESVKLRFDRQAQIAGVGRVDFLIDGWLIVEINGFQFHSSRAAWRKDMSRSNIAQTQAYAVLSYAPEQIWNSPDMVLKEIHAVLKRGRPRG
ncbi:hypothetical protein GCM10009712_29650 [Pseudarthrobacter sulfonivorans]